MGQQETAAEKHDKVLEGLKKVTKIPQRSDGGSKFKKVPPEATAALKDAKKKKKLPRKVLKKRAKQEKKTKPLPPPLCRYIEGIDCIYVGAKWIGIADELKKRDKLGRPKPESNFCKATCLPHVMGKHQVTSLFGMGVTVSKQFSQMIAALNVIAQRRQLAPKVAERKHPSAPATSLRTLSKTPETNIKPPAKTMKNNE